MRLGEIKQKIDRVISENKIIVIKNEPLYGEQAQKVTNYSEIMDVLELLSGLEWNDVQNSEITEQLLRKYPKGNVSEMLPLADYNILTAFIGRINEKLPFYYSILETMVEKQDEQIINIKLSEKVNSLTDLEKFNKDLSSLFKKFNLAGEFQFKGFDNGTSWYEILITGVVLYKYFIACLAVAFAIVELKKTYYDAEQSKLNYLASLRGGEEATEEGRQKFTDRYIKIYLEEKIKEVIEKIGDTNGNAKPEITSHLVMATNELVKQLGEGVEFHLSLNPPQYAREEINSLAIDYKKMPKIDAENSKPKQISIPKEDKQDEK